MKGPLAVMDHAAGCVKRGTLVPGKYVNGCTAEAADAAKALRDAREEVAELVEADRELDAAMNEEIEARRARGNWAVNPLPHQHPAVRRLNAAWRRRARALSAFA